MDHGCPRRPLPGPVSPAAAPAGAQDPYLQRLAMSPDLAQARSHVFVWRVYQLERSCPLVAALLRRQQALGPTLASFIAAHGLSPFDEFPPRAFLAHLAADADPLRAAVARFEQALAVVRAGDTGLHEVAWPVDPRPVLQALTQGGTLPGDLPHAAWVARVHHALPGLYALARA